ncbi:MAG TPA: cyclodeaminase/cyclohydrolase family protein, partial [Chitinophagaceae bacterium]|nr:cyclodeaminase/cyclohydrolase family protein [Chitinophagaceae bacterium]
FSDWAEKGQRYKAELLQLVDADTRAFNLVMSAFALPKSTEEEKQFRQESIQEATRIAIEVPFKVMEAAHGTMEIIRIMAEKGNPNSVTDAGVGALCARSAVMGAYMNVRINAASYGDKNFVNEVLTRGREIENKTIALEQDILNIVNAKLGDQNTGH